MFLLLYSLLVPLQGVPTWCLHTELYKLRWNTSPRNAWMKNRSDLNLGEVVYISIIYHIPDSWLNLLNGYDCYFWWRDSVNEPQLGTDEIVIPFYAKVSSCQSSFTGKSTGLLIEHFDFLVATLHFNWLLLFTSTHGTHSHVTQPLVGDLLTQFRMSWARAIVCSNWIWLN